MGGLRAAAAVVAGALMLTGCLADSGDSGASDSAPSASKRQRASSTSGTTGSAPRSTPAVTAGEPAAAKDDITRFDFGATAWTVDGDTIQLKNGAAYEAGVAQATATLLTNWNQPIAESSGERIWKDGPPPPADVNGDGYLDAVKGLWLGDHEVQYYLWLWDPALRRPVQIKKLLGSNGLGGCGEQSVRDLALKTGGVEVTTVGLVPGSTCDYHPPSTQFLRWTGEDLVAVRGDGKPAAQSTKTATSSAKATTSTRTTTSKAWPSRADGWSFTEIEDPCVDYDPTAERGSRFGTTHEHFSCGATAASLLVCKSVDDQVTCIVDYARREAATFTTTKWGGYSFTVPEEPDPLQVRLTNGVTCDPVSHDHDLHPNERVSWLRCTDGASLLVKGDSDAPGATYFDKTQQQWTAERAVGTNPATVVRVAHVTYAG